MTKMPISGDLVGLSVDPIAHTWTERDVMLYALGIGCRPPDDLDFIYEGHGPKVVPTFAVIPGLRAMGHAMQRIDINLAALLHGEQSVVTHRPLPPNADITVDGEITAVWDKGKAAVIEFEGRGYDADGPLFTVGASLFVLGGGGWGGERGPGGSSATNAVPDRDPDIVVERETRPEQAAIYRLSGDMNPMHIDPDFATKAGFPGTFNHGLCTFGTIGHSVLGAWCGGDVDSFESIEGRFADQVWPSDTILTKIWDEGDHAIVEARTQRDNVVVSNGRATKRS
jgi:acyl dehydratase